MSVGVNQKSAFAEDLGIEQGVADGDPKIGNFQFFTLKVDQNDRSRIGPMKLIAFPIYSFKYGASNLFILLGFFAIQQHKKLVTPDSINRQTCVSQDNAHPMQHGVACDMSILGIKCHKVIQVDEQKGE